MARALITQDPVNLSALTLTEQQILEKLSPILNYCPVDLKLRTFNPQPIRGRYLVYYDDQIYLCANEKAQSDFIDNPIKYVINSLDKYNIPVPSALARSEKDLEFQGKCPIALSLGQLEDGHSHLIIQYKKKWFSFATVAGLRQFEYNPKQFKRAHLPDKMPLVFENHKVILMIYYPPEHSQESSQERRLYVLPWTTSEEHHNQSVSSTRIQENEIPNTIMQGDCFEVHSYLFEGQQCQQGSKL